MSVKILTIVGARPQFIKAAAVSRAVAGMNRNAGRRILHEVIVHTGQHYDNNMSKIFFEEMQIPQPAYHLEVGSGTHGRQTGIMLERIEQVLMQETPDVCLVYGDTNSTLAGALAAVKLHIPVAHVEAGLRSFYKKMPEEINRILTDHVSALLFCPTDAALTNLKNEGITRGVHPVGDVMFDCTRFYADRAVPREKELLDPFRITPRKYYLATIHRAENTDDENRLREILCGLNAISAPDCPVVLPLHPRTAKYMAMRALPVSEHVHIAEPVSYLTMLVLEKNAKAILTDSGGVQKEAFFLSVPCITLRDQTEWVETVESGWNCLAGADAKRIADAAGRPDPGKDARPDSIYGDGHAAEKITELLSRIPETLRTAEPL